MPEALLDSTTLIDIERAFKHRREQWAANTLSHLIEYHSLQGRPYISVITGVEILKGLHRNVDREKAREFTRTARSSFQFLDVTTDVAFLAAEIMAALEIHRQSIGFPDSLIAATAIQRRFTLVTSNDRHFQRVINLGFPLQLDDWRKD